MIFSATVPEYIQEIALQNQKNPVLLDLVGSDTNQIPKTIANYGVFVEERKEKHAILKDLVMSNLDKKIMIFTETKKDAKDLGMLQYAHFLPLHGDLPQNDRTRAM